jgi:hypothetical protein
MDLKYFEIMTSFVNMDDVILHSIISNYDIIDTFKDSSIMVETMISQLMLRYQNTSTLQIRGAFAAVVWAVPLPHGFPQPSKLPHHVQTPQKLP